MQPVCFLNPRRVAKNLESLRTKMGGGERKCLYGVLVMPGIDQLLQRSTTVVHGKVQRNGGCTLPSIKSTDMGRLLTSGFPNSSENLRPKQGNEMHEQFCRVVLAGGLRPTVQHALPVRAL